MFFRAFGRFWALPCCFLRRELLLYIQKYSSSIAVLGLLCMQCMILRLSVSAPRVERWGGYHVAAQVYWSCSRYLRVLYLSSTLGRPFEI